MHFSEEFLQSHVMEELYLLQKTSIDDFAVTQWGGCLRKRIFALRSRSFYRLDNNIAGWPLSFHRSNMFDF